MRSATQILSLCYTSAPEGVHVNVIIGGLANGKIMFWSSWDLSEVCELSCPTEECNPVLSLAVSSCSTKLYAGYSNQQVVTWVKPETGDEETGDYVLVPPPNTLHHSPQLSDKAAQSTTSVLKYF
ncbi:PREDICTED: lysosomal-trafficking regulator-like [Amphimedon queenslandica]|nr:PREDICTED: lysosomal-trafficking regulator-like [Amphimedon queenslandica]|eukprot:XP_019849297.1 PREDICTED: lysosomal-trafficking regulator-like [Amphimedon queenslandica]